MFAANHQWHCSPPFAASDFQTLLCGTLLFFCGDLPWVESLEEITCRTVSICNLQWVGRKRTAVKMKTMTENIRFLWRKVFHRLSKVLNERGRNRHQCHNIWFGKQREIKPNSCWWNYRLLFYKLIIQWLSRVAYLVLLQPWAQDDASANRAVL